jgi:hypothetical protein
MGSIIECAIMYRGMVIYEGSYCRGVGLGPNPFSPRNYTLTKLNINYVSLLISTTHGRVG